MGGDKLSLSGTKIHSLGTITCLSVSGLKRLACWESKGRETEDEEQIKVTLLVGVKDLEEVSPVWGCPSDSLLLLSDPDEDVDLLSM